MITHHHRHRVRYRECDRMGIVYYVHFLDHFEAARTELIRSRGLSYKQIEDSGILMPVVRVDIRYRKPAYYDDVLDVKTIVLEPPSTRLELLTEIRREDESEILVAGRTTLCFVDRDRGRPIRAPEFFVEALAWEPGQDGLLDKDAFGKH
ncbi:MAG: acyl-CoA thioesterase [Rhodothermia bacterium]